MSYFGYKSIDGQNVPDLRKAFQEPLSKAAAAYAESLEKRKEEALILQRESSKAVRNSPYGLSTSAQQAALNLATTGAGRLQKLNKDYNSGAISFKEYKFAQQNIVDETLSQYDVLTKSSALSKAKYEAIAKGEEDPMSVYIGDKLQKESNLSDLTPDYTPEGILVYKKSDGTELSGREVVQMQTFRLPKYNYLSGVNDFMKEVGTKEALGFGKIATTTSVLNNPNFKEAKRKYIESQLANPYTVQSILGQTASDLNSVYTDNPEEAERDPNKILIRPGQNALGFEPVITEHHKEIVRKELESQIETRVSSVLQLKPEGQKTENKPTEGEQKLARAQSVISNAYYGGADKRNAFISAISSARPGIQNAAFTNVNGVPTFTYKQVSASPTGGQVETSHSIPLSSLDDFAVSVAPLLGVTIGAGEMTGQGMGSTEEVKGGGEKVVQKIPTSSTTIVNIEGLSNAFKSKEIASGVTKFSENLNNKGYYVAANVKEGKGYFTVKNKDGSETNINIGGSEDGVYQGTRVQRAMDRVLAHYKNLK